MGYITQMDKPGLTFIDDLVHDSKETGNPISIIIDMDSQLAEDLVKRNTDNRELSQVRIKRLRHDLEHDKWVLNFEAIKIDTEGRLIDGQHRAHAVAGTNFVMKTLIIAGVDPEARMTMDQIRPRNAADYLVMRGEQEGPVEAAIAKLLIAYEKQKGESLKGLSRATNADVVDYFDKHRDAIRASASFAGDLRAVARSHATPKVLGMAHYLLSNREPEKADTYIEQIARGENIKEGDAAYAVRARLLALGNVGAQRKLAVILAGWKPFLNEREVHNIKLRGSNLPSLDASNSNAPETGQLALT